MVLSDKQNSMIKQQRQQSSTTGVPPVTVGGDNMSIGANDTKRSNITYSSREKDRSKPSKSVNFRPSSLINERDVSDSNNNNTAYLPKTRGNYSYDSQTNRIPVLNSDSQSSYYAQAIG